MNTISLNEQNYTYSIQRQTRKTLQLQLLPNYTLLLKAPKTLPLTDILTFIQQKADWITKKNALLNDAPNTLLFNDKTTLPLLGGNYPLNIAETFRRPSIRFTGNAIDVNLYVPAASQLPMIIKNWYQQQALSILTQKTRHWSNKIGTTVNKLTIKDQKTRWGSCSSLGNINYNWRIIMAPESIVDYLVIHEVSHRLFLNHSTDFWNLVKRHSPNYIEHKLWLKEHGHKLFEVCPN